MKHIREWTPPAGFRSGDSVDLTAYKGGRTTAKTLNFTGWNLAELIKWRKVNREFTSARQRARFDVALNKAMTRADSTFVNHHDNANGIKDPETGKWLLEPGYWGAP